MAGEHALRLLLDQNLGPSLKRRLADLGCDIAHVADYGMEAADDALIWNLALREGFTIVSKDEDFRLRVAAHGHPPRVVLLKIGNCPLHRVEQVLRDAWTFVQKLHDKPEASFLLISPDATFLLVHAPRP